ncbi:MAG: leucine--tRNA ligase [bacterium]
MSSYPFEEIERKWQKNWQKNKSYEVNESAEKPHYVLEMFPYPSGRIHMGHVRNYTIGDAIARYFRRRGKEVLHPMGWDSFGLPAENAAIERGIHPRDWTLNNIEEMRGELKRLGFSYDWRREVMTCDPGYYRWNQWIFIELYKQGLVYRDSTAVNWCPHCKTVLANEQVHDDLCWRCDSEVVEKKQHGWFFKITDYARQLLDDMQQLEGWPEEVLQMQRNWIGRSHGASIDFEVVGVDSSIEVFTTRPDTLYGATYMALSPRHPLVEKLVSGGGFEAEVDEFMKKIEKTAETVTTDGVFTGRYAINPINGEEIPIYLADYVLMEYGTGAIMAVPAHDERDFEFATYHDIDIVQVIAPAGELADELEEPYTGEGVLINSEEHEGLDSSEARREISQWLEQEGRGRATINYRLRDWGISRQRYWGTPIPIVYCQDCGTVAVDFQSLPVELPDDVEFTSSGNILADCESFVNTDCPKCGGPAKRETDTMDTFVDSSWYYARYTSPWEDEKPFDRDAANHWLPVDNYIGGIEHACMHLLYARFFHKVLRDSGLLDSDEPFKNLLTQGMVLLGGEKMSKSKGNVVDPDEMMEKYGADTVRLFTLFAAPPQKDLEWDESGLQGAFRYLNRLWTFAETNRADLTGAQPEPPAGELNGPSLELHRKTHQTIRDVTADLEEQFQFNTAIASCMELFNKIQETGAADPAAGWSFSVLLNLLFPITPHFSNELAQKLEYDELPEKSSWPSWSEEAARADEVEVVVQVNGKVRARLTVPRDYPDQQLEEEACRLERIQEYLGGDQPRKVIVIPNKLVNIVI